MVMALITIRPEGVIRTSKIRGKGCHIRGILETIKMGGNIKDV
jgi:hypothetical protein